MGVRRYKPRKIHFEDLDSGVLESKNKEALELKQYPSSESLNQEEIQSDISSTASQELPQESLPEASSPLESQGPTSFTPRGRGRPRKTELTTKATAKVPLPKPSEEIERIKNKKGTPLTKMIQMRLKGLSVKEIADQLGMKYNTVLITMRNLFNLLDREKIIAFEKYKNEIYSAIEFELLDLMFDPEKRAEAKLQNIAYAFDRIHNARRLEQGKSTENIGFHVLIEEMEKHRETKLPEIIKKENPVVEVLQ